MKTTLPESVKRLWTVYSKEMLDHHRDRRSIFVILIYPVFAPILIGILVLFMNTLNPQKTASPLTIGVIHLDQPTPASQNTLLKDTFLQAGITLEPLAFDQTPPHDNLPFEKRAVVLIIKQGLSIQQFTVVYNPYHQESSRIAALVEENLYKYREQRLLEYFKENHITITLDPIEKVHIGEPQNVTKFLLHLIPMLLLFTLFYGSVHVAIDATVGERERGSWEMLRSAPLMLWELLLSKGLAAMSFSLLALLLQLLAFLVILNGFLAEYLAPSSVPLQLWFILCLVCLPLLLMAAVIQILIGIISRTTKEAHLYAGLLPLLPVFISLNIAFSSPVEGGGFLEVIPFLGQLFLFQRLFEHLTLGFGLGSAVLVTVTTLLTTTGLFLLTVMIASKKHNS